MDINTLPEENSKRFVAVLNKKIETGKLMNALGHMSAALAAQVEHVEHWHMLEYPDADGNVHAGPSHFPYIILKADNGNKIRTLRLALLEHEIPFTIFTDTMFFGTDDALAHTKAKREEEFEYVGICMFGEAEVIKQLTGKFSLFR